MVIKATKVRKRVLASVLDYVVYLILVFAYTAFLGEETERGNYRVEGLMALPLVFIWLLYFPIMEGLTGQTLGKKILKIRLATSGGKDVNLVDAIVRRLFDPIDMAFVGLVGLIIMKA